MTTAIGTVERDAARLVAEVRDDPEGRIRLAADSYALHGRRWRHRPYRRAVVAFMRWQQARGVLNAPHIGSAGSPWWRAVNEDLLRDTVEAKLLVERGGGVPSRPTVARWVSFFTAPSARSWYQAHNASVVAGYLAHRGLAEFEAPAERFFMNVVLVRVLFAHALVLDANLALGRLSFLGRVIGHPRARGPQTLLALNNVLPERYPVLESNVEHLVAAESRLGRILDFGVIAGRVAALYSSSAHALDEPGLLELVQDGAPSYAWPSEQRHVWMRDPKRRPAVIIDLLIHPRSELCCPLNEN
jgi:hypothetical protein